MRNLTESRLQVGANPEQCSSADGVITIPSATNGATNHGGVMTRSAEDKSSSADGVIVARPNARPKLARSTSGAASMDPKFSTNSLTRLGHQHPQLAAAAAANHHSGSLHRLIHRPQSLNRETSGESALSPCVERRRLRNGGDNEEEEPPSDSSPSPPPKPMRASGTATLCRHESISAKDLPIENGPLNRVVSYHASGSDSGNGSGDSAQSSAAGESIEGVVNAAHRGGVFIKNPRYLPNSASSMTLKSYADLDYAAIEQHILESAPPLLVPATRFDLDNFSTLLLPSVENKPLDNGALNTFRMMLSETGPRVLANHLTRVDIKLILGEPPDGKAAGASDTDPLSCTGIELIALRHGDQFRMDLLERTECIRLLVAVTVLTCNCDEERADTLNKWIQVAVDTKTALGNLFGFCAIMLGLCMPQVS